MIFFTFVLNVIFHIDDFFVIIGLLKHLRPLTKNLGIFAFFFVLNIVM